jgi:hypothetical protein
VKIKCGLSLLSHYPPKSISAESVNKPTLMAIDPRYARRHGTMDAMPVSPHEPLDDLVRVLGYVDAIDQHDDIREVANEMFTMSCWTPQFCQALIRAAEAAGGFAAEPGDPVPGHEISLAMISPRLFEAVQNDMGERIWPQLQQHWPLIDYHGINDAFIIRYEIGGQEELRIHHDVAQVSASVKLNSDYTGAELQFPRQDFSNADMSVGSLIAWPSLVTHPHLSAPITSGVKYSLTIWFELPLSLQ